jgi:hypothetical protein
MVILTRSTLASPFSFFLESTFYLFIYFRFSAVTLSANPDKRFHKKFEEILSRWLIWATFLQIFSHPHLTSWENACRWCRLLKSGVEWLTSLNRAEVSFQICLSSKLSAVCPKQVLVIPATKFGFGFGVDSFRTGQIQRCLQFTWDKARRNMSVQI